ncbi:hypothetical protein SLEP1_g35686 [Rubroshorea leprosula]|uniref:Disease resistance protein At4g27190-like leucine-rich repeats domain-containing protein n=1 Tax=Rubroshorea leprosula TaxID=152421 RepID=A0AAV5KP61_9ROSI|nr:hypothetical protein SLEP1_g35686 [Rubroshorea leprosula]
MQREPTRKPESMPSILDHLEKLIVQRNESMKEILHGDDVKDGIVFTNLESLQLKVLPRLESFCSGNYNFEFPSLEDVTVMKCPNMQTFSERESGDDDAEEDWSYALHKLFD